MILYVAEINLYLFMTFSNEILYFMSIGILFLFHSVCTIESTFLKFVNLKSHIITSTHLTYIL